MKEAIGCNLCPRACGVDRKTMPGRCHVTDTIKVARAALHFWEEPCISGEEGSGAVFFSGCNLGCVYCQNRDIAAARAGKEIDKERLVEIFLELQAQHANNINLVTAGHYIKEVTGALEEAKKRGLFIPIVYNSSGYEKAEELERLRDLVSIYLPDFKYITPALAEKYSHASDYPEVAKKAIDRMVNMAGAAEFDSRELMKRGVIVRHLVLPGYVEESKAVIHYLYETYGNRIYLSIMNQYTPLAGVEKAYPELGRRVTAQEYDEVVDYAIELGVENGFIQEEETAEESFIPAFDLTGV